MADNLDYRIQRMYLDGFRTKFPEYSNMNDEALYGIISDFAKEDGDEMAPYLPPVYQSPTNRIDTSQKDVTSPTYIGQLFDYGKKLALSGAAELGAEQGLKLDLPGEAYDIDISADAFKKSYNESNVGHLYEAIHGKKKYDYDLEDYDKIDQGYAADAGSFLLGMLSPFEGLIIASSGGLGKIGASAVVGGSNLAKKYALKSFTSNASKGISPLSQRLIGSAVSGGIGLGVFGAAHTSLVNAADQKRTTGKIDYWKAAEAGAHGFADSALLGAPMGLIGRGALGHYYASRKLSEKPLMSVQRFLAGVPGQLTTEIAAFSGIPNVYKELHKQGVPYLSSYEEYPDVMNPDGTMNNEWMEQAGFNAMIVTPMFGFFRMLERWKGKPHEDSRDHTKEVDLMDIVKAEGGAKAAENVHSTIGDIKLTNNIIQDMYKLRENLDGIKLDAKTYKDNIDRFFRILERAEGDYSKLSPDEIAFLTGKGAEALQQMHGKMIYLSENPEILKDVIRRSGKKKGIELSEDDLILGVEANANNIESFRDIFDTIETSLSGRGKGAGEEIPIQEAPRADRVYENPRKTSYSGEEMDLHTTIEDRILSNKNITDSIGTKETIDRINAEKYVNDKLREPEDLLRVLTELENNLAVQSQPKPVKGTILNNSDFKATKDTWEHKDKKIQQKVRRSIEKLAQVDKQIVDEAINYKGRDRTNYDINSHIVRYYIQQELPTQRSAGGATKGSLLLDPAGRAGQYRDFSKYVVDKGYSFEDVPNTIIKKYLNKNTGHVEMMQHLVKELKSTWGNNVLTISESAIAEAASAITTLPPPGLRTGANDTVLTKDSITMVISKQAKLGMQTKILTEETAAFLTRLQKAAAKKGEHYFFTDNGIIKLKKKKGIESWVKLSTTKEFIIKNGQKQKNPDYHPAKSINNKIASELVGMFFGIKPKTTSTDSLARKFRKSMATWAEEKFGFDSPQQHLVLEKVLLDKSDANIIRDHYGKKDWNAEARQLVEEYVKDIQSGKDLMKQGDAYYTTKEIKAGLEKFAGHKGDIEVQISKTIKSVIPRETVEGMFKYLIEAGPRMNELVTPNRMDAKIEPQYQRKAKGAPTAEPEFLEFLRQMAVDNPGVDIRTIRGADYAAKFQEGVIYITLGKANKGSWYHENAHALEKMIFDTGNKELMAIWKQGEKLFKNDAEAAGESIKEFIPDQIQAYAEGRLANKSVASKMRAWTGRLWTKIKQVFFGKSSLNKNDIVKILGEKVYKGFARTPKAEGLSMPQYQFANNTDRAKFVKKNFDDAMKLTGKKMSRKDKKILTNYIAQRAGIENPNLFRLGSGTMNQADIIAFDNMISSVSFKDLVKLADVGKRINKWMKISDLEDNFVSKDDRTKILNLFGVPKGKIELANMKQLSQYGSYLTKKRYPDSTPFEASIQHENMKNIASQLDIKDMGTIRRMLYTGFGETASVLEAMNLKTASGESLVNKLRRHSSKEQDLIGDFNSFERLAEKELGASFGGTIENPLQVRKAFGKQKEGMSMLDIERYAERLNTGTLNRHQKKFMSKAVKKDAVVVKDGKYIINEKYKEDITRALDLNTPQGRVAKEWNNLTESFKTELDSALRSHFKSESDYQAWLDKSGGIDWITDNFYMYRKLTPEMMQVMGKGRGGAYQKKIEESIALDMAKNSALEKYGSKVTEEQIKTEFLEVFPEAQRTVNQMFKFNQGKLANAIYIKNRTKLKLPEFVTIDGKKIEVFETGYEPVIKGYALGMSKLIANIKEFPDMVDWVSRNGKVRNMSGQTAKWGTSTLLREVGSHRKWGNWIKEAVNRELGIHETAQGLGADIGGIGDKAAAIFSKAALSFPTHAGVNLIYGQAHSLHTWKFREYFGGVLKSFNKDFREEVRRRGVLELGLKDITTIKTQTFWDWVFSWGGMRQTENINRYIDVAASTYETTRLIRTIQHKGPNTRKYKKAINRFKDFYNLEDNQIELLKKYGEYGIDGHSGLTSFQKGKIRKELLDIEQQLRHYAHVNVQGASGSLFQPGWASNKALKPLTLFWRMAYASSVNKLKNFNLAKKNGDYLKIMMMGLSPVMGGMAISSMYNWAIGTPKIKENASWYEWIKGMLLRGEVFGFATNGLRILDGQSAEFTISPALHSWGGAWIDAIRAPIEGTKTIAQSTDDFMKSTFSGYRNTIRAIEARKYPDKVQEAKYGRLWNDFLEEKAPKQVKPRADYDLTTLSPIYRDFRSVFRKGTPEEIAKQYIISLFSLASEIYRLGTDASNNPLNPNNKEEHSLKDAESRLKGIISHMNPNPISFFDKLESKNQKDLAPHWLEYLKKDPVKYKEYITGMATLEGKYKNKVHALRVNKMLPEYIKDDAVMKSIKKSLRTIAYHKSIK